MSNERETKPEDLRLPAAQDRISDIRAQRAAALASTASVSPLPPNSESQTSVAPDIVRQSPTEFPEVLSKRDIPHRSNFIIISNIALIISILGICGVIYDFIGSRLEIKNLKEDILGLKADNAILQRSIEELKARIQKLEPKLPRTKPGKPTFDSTSNLKMFQSQPTNFASEILPTNSSPGRKW